MRPIFLRDTLSPATDLRRRRIFSESTRTTADMSGGRSGSSGAARQLIALLVPLPANMAVDAASDEEERVADCIEWTPENEIHLFNALKNRRPVGLNRYFQMVFISENFNNLTNRDVPSAALWDHLSELYDMETLNENDTPASSVVDERDFALSSDFDDLLEKKVNGQSEAAPVTSMKATSLLKPAANATPKQSKSKMDPSRKESRSVKEEDGKGDESKSAKKKSIRPSESASKSATPSSSNKKRRI